MRDALFSLQNENVSTLNAQRPTPNERSADTFVFDLGICRAVPARMSFGFSLLLVPAKKSRVLIFLKKFKLLSDRIWREQVKSVNSYRTNHSTLNRNSFAAPFSSSSSFIAGNKLSAERNRARHQPGELPVWTGRDHSG